MEPTYADFTTEAIRLGNAEVTHEAVQWGQGHATLDCGGSVDVSFRIDAGDRVLESEATLEVTALVSKLDTEPGSAPLDIIVNQQMAISAWAVPGGGDLPQVNRFAIPCAMLRPGENTLSVRSAADSTSLIWLYRITLDPVFERDRSAKALRAAGTVDEVLVYRTEVRAAGDLEWHPHERLEVFLGQPHRSQLTNLSWQGDNGGRATVAFTTESFRGGRRSGEGHLYDYRGMLVERAALAWDALPEDLVTFAVRRDWGQGWFASGRLVALVRGGDGRLAALSWRDDDGGTGAIELAPDRSRFIGYHQAVGEGPVGYEGKREEPRS